MDYQIKYDIKGASKRTGVSNPQRKNILLWIPVILTLALLLWSADIHWGNTWNALEEMAQALENGERIQEAFSGFCLDVLGDPA